MQITITGKQLHLGDNMQAYAENNLSAVVEKYFDDAMLCGLKQFTIIHGYGTGTIRSLVQSYLKTHKAVESYRYGGAGEGGMGVTVVTLK